MLSWLAAATQISGVSLGLVSAVSVLVLLLLVWYALEDRGKPGSDSAAEAVRACSTSQATPLPTRVESSVAACYAGEFGRFKFCGLRPDPLDASLGPPVYSTEPLDLPLPALSAEEAATLRELGRRVADMASSHRADPGTLVRYLRARKFNIDKAENHFRMAAQWRDQVGAHRAFTHWNLRAYEECLAPWWLSGGLMGHGLQGEQVAYERLGWCDFSGLARRMPWDELVKLDVVHCHRSLAALEEDSLRRGTPLGSGILVIDCWGFGMNQANLFAARKLNRIIENRNFLMPECLTRILMIRAPKACVYAWQTLSYIMDPGVREKVHVAGEGQSLELLRRHIADEEIPAFLGGRKTVEGDPQCRKVLAPGGPLPEEVFQRFLQLLAEVQSPLSNGSGESCNSGGSSSSGCFSRARGDAEEGGKRSRSCCG